ncbi:RsmE family RNA methyltransferase [Oceanivirga salmonicida]|uniref:RsmE family RNA methyltransferase n=1 Tax=Oceanivirga salmonicida TaxID=1769291 RepID=UPI0012E1100D|nr:16S rRNA (uracil(1498)-N(3))-methyltransferase [Oceanivirga salmonicida]
MLSIVIEKENKIDDNIIINNVSDIKHIVNVYRLNVGDEIRVVDNEFEYLTNIVKISKKEVLLKVKSKDIDKYSLNIDIDIAIGIIKNDKMKLLIKKLTEIGVNNIIPLKTERVIVKINEKKEKWEEVVKEAMKQCRAVKKTNLTEIQSLRDLDIDKYDKIVFMYENSNESLKLHEAVSSKDKKVLCIIGPEGGFSQKEVEFMKNKGFLEINLGNRILRAETAAILVASVLTHNYGY